MAIHLQKQDCSGCGACANVCPKKCIDMRADAEGFLYPHIEKKKCVECHLCEKTCPAINQMKSEAYDQYAFAAYCTDEKTRNISSSGGIFTVFAQTIIKNGGVVCGAAFNEKHELEHIIIDSVDDIWRLQGSKYLQSRVGDCYERVKNYLDRGQTVYFSGTPCQVEGLLNYLRKPYNNLITQDLICHGVPSPLVWKKYVELREKCANSKAERTLFRHKKYGWKVFSVLFSFENNTEYTETKDDDLYMKCFLQDLCLRPSCYECHYKKSFRRSDITLADYWGIEQEIPELFDDLGTSLVIVHSAKGQSLFREVSDQITSRETEIERAIIYNPAYIRSAKKPEERSIFMRQIQRHGIEESYNSVQEYRKEKTQKAAAKALKERRIRRYKRRVGKLWRKLFR